MFTEDNNARNGSREKKQRKTKTKMGERHHTYVWYDGNSMQSGGGQASFCDQELFSVIHSCNRLSGCVISTLNTCRKRNITFNLGLTLV